MVKGTFSPTATDNYYIGFNYDGKKGATLYVDDVLIQETAGIESVESGDIEIRMIGNNAMSIALGGEPAGRVTVYNMTGGTDMVIDNYVAGSVISTESLAEGCHIVTIETATAVKTAKIIVR